MSGLKDSGIRQSFDTGAVREPESDRGLYVLTSPFTDELLAKHFEQGAKKYSQRNWEKGQPMSRYLNSTLRHITQLRQGDESEDHLIAALWNLHCMIHTREMIKLGLLHKSLDDLPKYLHTLNAKAPPNLKDYTIDKIEELVNQK